MQPIQFNALASLPNSIAAPFCGRQIIFTVIRRVGVLGKAQAALQARRPGLCTYVDSGGLAGIKRLDAGRAKLQDWIPYARSFSVPGKLRPVWARCV